MDLVKLIVDNLPFSINDSLEVIRVLKSDLSTILLSLELKFEIQAENLRVVIETFRLLLEAGVGESFLEANTLDEEGISDRASCDLLDADILFVEGILVDRLDGIDNHSTEESLLFSNNLRVKRCLGALF